MILLIVLTNVVLFVLHDRGLVVVQSIVEIGIIDLSQFHVSVFDKLPLQGSHLIFVRISQQVCKAVWNSDRKLSLFS